MTRCLACGLHTSAGGRYSCWLASIVNYIQNLWFVFLFNPSSTDLNRNTLLQSVTQKNITGSEARQRPPLSYTHFFPKCNGEWDSWHTLDNPQTKPCSENTDGKGAPSARHTPWGLKGLVHLVYYQQPPNPTIKPSCGLMCVSISDTWQTASICFCSITDLFLVKRAVNT